MKLFIDDIREAPDQSWILYRSYYEAFSFACDFGDFITEISLDHDMGENEPTGYDFLCRIEGIIYQQRKFLRKCKFTIHSANPVGRKNMEAAINSIERFRKEG